jgi:geranylgeranyl pyrophosphate synthase
VLDIFRQKTAPAFEVALRLGAAYAGADQELSEVLQAYSEALGIAYQIRDDLDDLQEEADSDDVTSLRPTLPMAIGHEKAKGEGKGALAAAWRREPAHSPAELRALLEEAGAVERSRGLLDAYKEEAVRSLAELENASLKGLLRRVIGKIFKVEVKGWCSEFEARNAAGSAAGAAAAG